MLSFWPRDRYLEPAPKYWNESRARLDALQLDVDVGFIDVRAVTPDDALK